MFFQPEPNRTHSEQNASKPWTETELKFLKSIPHIPNYSIIIDSTTQSVTQASLQQLSFW